MCEKILIELRNRVAPPIGPTMNEAHWVRRAPIEISASILMSGKFLVEGHLETRT